jgi:hypothetical protein
MTAPATTGRSRGQQAAALALLVAVLGGVIWFEFFRTAGSSPTTSNSVGSRRDAAPATLPIPQVVRLKDLQTVSEPTEPTRNPFAYGARPAPPPPAVDPSRPAPVTMPSIPAPVVPQGPPPITLRLAGVTVVPGTGRTMVTLKDPDSNAVFQAFEGDIVDGRYRIVKVLPRSVVISYVDGTGTRTIPLGG